jgi:hypothetical protein
MIPKLYIYSMLMFVVKKRKYYVTNNNIHHINTRQSGMLHVSTAKRGMLYSSCGNLPQCQTDGLGSFSASAKQTILTPSEISNLMYIYTACDQGKQPTAYNGF